MHGEREKNIYIALSFCQNLRNDLPYFCGLSMTLTAPQPVRRIASVDLLRGVLMVIMALDHTRDFFSNATVNPTDPLNSWPALFFTRWITHLCAPGFVALAGTSIYLQRLRGRTHNQVAKRLVTRGLWLIFMELAVVSFVLTFTYKFHVIEVIYAIGASMVLLAGLQYLPTKFVALYGIAVVALHNLADPIDAASLGHFASLYTLTMQPGGFLSHGKLVAFVPYPMLPWSGVMALGYAFGAIVTLPPRRRRSISLVLGAFCLAVLTILRLTDSYGDQAKFTPLPTVTRSAMSFFQLTKYPPSLHFILATLGFLLLMFALADYVLERRWLPRLAAIVEVYGRVPFFYFVLHLLAIHLAVVFTLMARVHTLHPTLFAPFVGSPPPGWGFGLPTIYAIWIAVVIALYIPCRWFANIKARRRDWWLSYL
jgi:uncharacterized membrane protein